MTVEAVAALTGSTERVTVARQRIVGRLEQGKKKNIQMT